MSKKHRLKQPTSPGIVHLVGAGPGDPGLITVRGRQLLAVADVIVYDALVTPELLALCRGGAELIFAGKRPGRHTLEQGRINQLLAKKAGQGKRVVRLKGGDPYLFGRGAEEALYLAARGIPVEVVPGVTAGIAAPACAGIPLTHRHYASAVAFITGHEDPDKPRRRVDLSALAGAGTLCFYMGVRNLDRIARELAAHLPAGTPAAVIQWGATPRQRTVVGRLSDIAARARRAGIRPPAVTVVGRVVGLRGKLAFYERRPLFGRRIVVTRAREQAGELAEPLRALGADVLLLPVLRIEPPTDTSSLAAVARRLENFDWVVFTSVNGVDALMAELDRQRRDARAFGKARLAAIGSATSERLARHGLRADLVPGKYLSAEIVAELEQAGALASPGRNTPRPRFLLPRADIAPADLAERLRAHDVDVTEVVAYRTVAETEGQEEALKALAEGAVDALTFTSSSTVRFLTQILGPAGVEQARRSPRLKCFSIGPVTSAAMRELGWRVDAEAAVHDIPGLVAAVSGARI